MRHISEFVISNLFFDLPAEQANYNNHSRKQNRASLRFPVSLWFYIFNNLLAKAKTTLFAFALHLPKGLCRKGEAAAF